MEKEYFIIAMVVNTMENGKMMLSMDMESIIEMMEISMKVNGKMILEMEKELL